MTDGAAHLHAQKAAALLLLAAAILSALALLPGTARAHDARPVSVAITQQTDETYHAVLAVPSSVDGANHPDIIWPANCTRLTQSVSDNGMARKSSAMIRCPGGLEDKTIRIGYPLYNPSLSTVIRLTSGEAPPRMTVLPPEKTQWTVPSQPSWQTVARDYLLLGIEHILGGIDHLLFVAGLLILARTGRRVLLVVTGFTIAHSITLSLSALDVIRVPVMPTEAAIALSILFLASEIARGREDSLAFRYPLLVSSTFGLLHGLGFASALKDVGLPSLEVSSALLFFNLGVEVGQIAFILPVLLVFRLAVKGGMTRPLPALERLQIWAGYGLGIPASWWFFERLAQF